MERRGAKSQFLGSDFELFAQKFLNIERSNFWKTEPNVLSRNHGDTEFY